MNTKIIFTAFVSGLLFYTFGSFVGYSNAKNEWEVAGSNALSTADMVGLINTERERVGLEPLKENLILDKTAEIKACDMVENDYFAHEDLQGRKSWHLFEENGYHYAHAGENLARNNGVFEEMRQLMASPEHRENILMPEYTDIGIGVCGKYTVQHFGRQ